MKTLDPGAFRHSIELQRDQPIDDGCGGFEKNWTPVATIWAQVSPVSVRTSNDEGTDRSSLTHHILVRWRDDCEPGVRFKFGGRIMNIRHVRDPDETGRYLVCECEEMK